MVEDMVSFDRKPTKAALEQWPHGIERPMVSIQTLAISRADLHSKPSLVNDAKLTDDLQKRHIRGPLNGKPRQQSLSSTQVS